MLHTLTLHTPHTIQTRIHTHTTTPNPTPTHCTNTSTKGGVPAQYAAFAAGQSGFGSPAPHWLPGKSCPVPSQTGWWGQRWSAAGSGFPAADTKEWVAWSRRGAWQLCDDEQKEMKVRLVLLWREKCVCVWERECVWDSQGEKWTKKHSLIVQNWFPFNHRENNKLTS